MNNKSAEKKALLLMNVISVKGGVGKSTMALMSAAYLARKHGVKVWVIDADFSGTSIIEGLTHHKKIKMKSKIKQKHLHDYLTLPPIADIETLEDNIKSIQNDFLKSSTKDPGWVKIINSKPYHETKETLEPLTTTEHWTRYLRTRICRLIEALCSQEQEDTPVAFIIDHGPGLHNLNEGFIDPGFKVASPISTEEFLVNHRYLMVSSGDNSDITATAEIFGAQLDLTNNKRKEAEQYFILFNRLQPLAEEIGKEQNKETVTKYTSYIRKTFKHHWSLIKTYGYNLQMANPKLSFMDALTPSRDILASEELGDFLGKELSNLAQFLDKSIETS